VRNIVYVFVVIACVLAFTGCDSANNNPNQVSTSLYDEILDRGSIKVGYINYPPSYIVFPDGRHSGIFHDVFEEIADKLGINVEYSVEVTWDGMIEDVRTKKVDMVVTGIWPTTERGKYVDFLDPLFFSAVKAYTQASDTRFDNNLEAINDPNVRIAAIDGEMTAIIAQLDFPQASRVDVTQLGGVSQALLDVQNDKADITFVEPIIALEFMAQNPGAIKEVEGIPPLRVFPNSMMIPKGEPELMSTLNTAINELLNNGFVDRVIDEYETYPGSYNRVQLPYRTNN